MKEAKAICDMLLHVTLSTFKEKVTFVHRNVLIYRNARNLCADLNSANCASVPASPLIYHILLKFCACTFTIHVCQLRVFLIH